MTIQRTAVKQTHKYVPPDTTL